MLLETITKIQVTDFKSKILDMLEQGTYSQVVSIGVLTGDNLSEIKSVDQVNITATNIERYIKVSKTLSNHTEIDTQQFLKNEAVKAMEQQLFTQIVGRATACTDITDMLTKCDSDDYIAVIPYGTQIVLDNFGRCGGVPVYFAGVDHAVMFKPNETYFAVSELSFIHNLPDEDILNHTDVYQMYVDFNIGCYGNCFMV